MAYNKVTIDVEARFNDNLTAGAKKASRSIDDVGKSADRVSKKKVKPIFDADNSKLLKKIRAAEEKAAKLGRTKTKMVLTAMDKATNVIGKAMNKAQSFAGKTYNAYLKIRDSEALGSLKKVVNYGKNLAGKTWTTVVKIKDLATAPLRGLKNMLFSIKSLVLAITAGLAAKQFVLNPINLADQYSGAKIGFSTLLGESQGQAMMDEIDEFAKATPFKTSGVISNVQKMMAYGWDVDRVIDDMETIGDAAAATGRGDQGLESIVYALSEIRSKGKLSTQELNQLASAGIKAKAYLAEGLGFGTDDAGMKKLAEALEDGAIGANQAIDLILEGMKEFDGMMDATANETVEGLKSQLEDTFEINILRRWGQGLQDGAKRGLGSVVSLLDDADSALERFGDTVYEVGKNVSNWLADKLENAVKRVTDITGSFEFKNASLGEKLSMLWKGVVVDPLKEWWDGGGQQKTAETAGKIGGWMGEMLTKGLLALFGATDVLEDIDGSDMGGNVAGSFVQGFLQNFDGSAITQAFVDAISNVWNALPTWAKFLVGGYVGGKAMGGIANFAGGVASFIGGTGKLIGSTGTAMVSGSGLLGGLASTGYALTGGPASAGAYFGAGMSGGTAALMGAGAIAGGVATGAGLIHAGRTGYQAYKDFKSGDKASGWANVARSGGTLAGMGVGAKVGASIGSLGGPVGTLIGAGLGTVVGWFAGDKIAKNIEAAKFESEEMKEAIKDSDASAEELAETFEKAKWENAKEHFGDIKLSLTEIERLAEQIVWGDDLGSFEKFSSATKQAEASLGSLKTASEQSERWLWKAGLGVKFNEDEQESMKASFDDYINSAKSYLENKHYEFTASAELILDLESEEGKGILESGNAFYAAEQEKLNKAGEELGDALSKALEDGIINADEEKAIIAAQEKIAEITNRINQAETDAEIELIKVKFGEGKLDLDSFETFMSTMETSLNDRMSAADEALKVQIKNLNLRFPEDKRNSEEYKQELETIIGSYETQVESIKAEVLGIELEIIGDAYAKELGDDAATDLQKALQYAIDEGIDPIEISDEKLAELLNVEELSGETAGNIKDMLSGVFGQLELIEVDGKVLLDLGIETEEDPAEEVKNSIPDTVEKTVGVDISGEKNIQNTIDILVEDFEIPSEQAATVALLLTGDKEILSKIDTSTLAKELGVPEDVAETIITKLKGSKSIEERVNVLGSDLVSDTEVWQTITVNLKAKVGKVADKIKAFFGGGDGSGYRGGIFGGSSALESFARGGIAGFSDGGMVRGGSQLIEVAEEGSPEMIIPLSSQRRGRALKLWAQAGHMMDVPGFARGGLTGGGNDEGIRFSSYGNDESSVGGQSVQIEVGGITVEIHVDATGHANIADAIQEQKQEIAETVAGILADALGGQFENTPTRGGAA